MNKDKYLQIFNYLLEFSKLRSKPVRDIEGSEQCPVLVWFADIPQCDIFDCVTFPNYKQDADYWLKISKPKEPQPPKFPKLSETLTDWIEKDSLTDENGTPKLKESISKNGQTILLSDLPEVATEFEGYLNNQWLDDLKVYKEEVETYKDKHQEFEAQSKTYRQLFSIYNKVHQFGEEFELVFGVGLLNFKENNDTPKICRHILTSKAEIIFDHSPRESFIKVLPSIQNEIQIETDAILDLVNQFDTSNIIAAESKVAKFLKENHVINNLFANQIKDAMQIFVDTIRNDGDWQSIDELSKPQETPKKPTVYLAPALLLRKRNAKNLTALYETIIKNIELAENEIDIPSLNDVLGGKPQAPDVPLDDGTLYFPKEYNEEQIQIINRARKNSKLLVQGPPGTGKSHTIANLICHLLANGKKVLVTAYTSRALEVLKDKLPSDFQELTVNFLSGDTASNQDLNKSVNAITSKLSNHADIAAYQTEIEELKIKLDEIKENIARTKNQWLETKVQASAQKNLNANYSGTLTEIAEQLETDSPKVSWFTDDCNDLEALNLITDIQQFYGDTKNYQYEDCNRFKSDVPNKENLLSIDDLREYKRIFDELQQHQQADYEHITFNNYQTLITRLEKLRRLIPSIVQCRLPEHFKESIINDHTVSLSSWNIKIVRTNEILNGFELINLSEFQRDVMIRYPENKTWAELKSDASVLLDYLKGGKRLNGIGFALKKPLLPVSIKQRLYFLESVKVLGHACDNIASIEMVLTDIKIKQDLKELHDIWVVKPTEQITSYSNLVGYYGQVKDNVESLINCVADANNTISEIANISNINIIEYDANIVTQWLKAAHNQCLLNQKTNLDALKDKTIHYLTNPALHPVAKDTINAIENLDTERYEGCFAEIDDIADAKNRYNRYQSQQEKLANKFPLLIRNITDGGLDLPETRQIQEAIYLKHATLELARLSEAVSDTRLFDELKRWEEKEKQLIAKLGAKKAWLSVLERLQTNHLSLQHLVAWTQAIGQIPQNGIGVNAQHFQRAAQQEMTKCKDAVPCWIMPLYKVIETVRPESGIYDYVIVDESSQLGADALFLLFISKNIIIVGDDKQTQPEYVGIQTNTMKPQINLLLQGIPFARFYDIQFSFFDHAKRFCNGKFVVLREHFRCMPEIIAFSNKCFYKPGGIELYPLKQYSENRLKPLQRVYFEDGNIDEGTGSNITNKVEAKGIADKIAALVQNAQYKGKSFGVIALQGNSQAALIESLVLQKIGAKEFSQRKIVCGNSASFQGDERDVMFLSLVTAHNHTRRAFTEKPDQRRFNVAMSRAREQVWLFHSVPLGSLHNHDLRYKLLDHFLNYNEQQAAFDAVINTPPGRRIPKNQPPPFDSWFEVDVYNDIVARQYGVIPQYKVGRYKIDFVVLLSNGVKIAVECDGDKYHGAAEIEKDQIREGFIKDRYGCQFFRVRGSEYYSNRKRALEPLWELLSKNNQQNTEQPVMPNDPIVESEEPEIPTNPNRPIRPRPVNPGNNNPTTQDDLFGGQVAINNARTQLLTGNRRNNWSSYSEFLVFTSKQNVYKVKNEGFTNKTQVEKKIKFEDGEKPVYVTGTDNYSGFLIVAFENGKIAKIDFTSYQTENRKKLKNAFNAESERIFIWHFQDDIDLIAVSNVVGSNKVKVIVFNTSKINKVGTTKTQGVQLMKLKIDSAMSTVKTLAKVKLNDPEYYRVEGIGAVGKFLKQGDVI